MEYADKLQKVIEEIAQKYQFDLSRVGARYQVELSDGRALIIEIVDPLQINIYHQPHLSYQIKLEIFTSWRWVPLSVLFSDGSLHHVSAVVDRESQNVNVIDHEGYEFLNRGCRRSAMSIRFDFLHNEKEEPKVTVDFNAPGLLKAA